MGVDFKQLVNTQRHYFRTGETLPVAFRLRQLGHLKLMMKACERELLAALNADLGKSAFEAYATELGMVYEEINAAMRNLERWAAMRRVSLPLLQLPASGHIRPEPYGVALIISPWNYPVQLTLSPLVSAIAAGNCAVVKPSAYAPNVSRALARMLGRLFPRYYVSVVEGGRQENAALLEQKFDKIFFTGSVEVGKAVMTAAARHLTPVTLELGGKSPVIVDCTANLKIAARRILWGKTVNSGQTCVAPDYVLADRRIYDRLLREMRIELKRLWGISPLSNEEYPRIVNEKHFNRLLELMSGQHIFLGGGYDRSALRIEPTVLDRVSFESPVMREEIFGPILPVIPYESLDEAIAFIGFRPKPLALYLFASDKDAEKRIFQEVSFGGGCINDTLMHLVSTGLPFGGVGESGMGRYHGKYGFDAFSHEKSIVRKGFFPDLPLRYPPYRGKLWLAKRFLK